MYKAPTKIPRAEGFSLVEVLVASAILVTVLTAVLGVFTSSVTGSRIAIDYQRALAVAVARMAEVSREGDLEPGAWGGTTRDGFRWHTTVEARAIAEDEMAVLRAVVPYEVAVRVAWQEHDRNRQVEIRSLRLGKRL